MAKKNRKNQKAQVGDRARIELPPGVKLLRTFKDHQGAVMSLAFDPRGEILASGSADKTIKLWETRTGKLIRTLDRSGDGVTSLAFAPQSGTLAAVSFDNTVELWEVESGKVLRTQFGELQHLEIVAVDPRVEIVAHDDGDLVILREMPSGAQATANRRKSLPNHACGCSDGSWNFTSNGR